MTTRSLFEDESPKPSRSGGARPLPELLRPESLEDVVGLEELLGEGKFLRVAIENDRIPSMIFWGPPGSGKTTLARIIAKTSRSRFVPLSAVTASIKDVKALMEEARVRREHDGTKTIVFIDEIHRFNRSQQDAFLPYVEAGDIVLIGATTENPSFEVNSALLSRCKVVVLPELAREEIGLILHRALQHPSIVDRNVRFDDSAIDFIAATSGGDARQALNSLQLVAETSTIQDRPMSSTDISAILQRRSLVYDKSGEAHYNIISALHKSLRNGDADAAIYWLTRMLEGGEDPMYLARRLVRASVEDIGLADPDALQHAIAAKDAVHFLGMPEAGVVLTQLVIYLTQAPKSNSAYEAYENARREVREGDNPPVPLLIRNAPTSLMKNLGYGEKYQYAHDYDEETTPMQCLPDSLAGRRFYTPKPKGREKEIADRLQRLRELRESMRGAGENGPETDRLHPRKK
jgi:putative ATPase